MFQVRVFIGKEITVLGNFTHKHVMAKVSSYEMPSPFSSQLKAVAVVQVTSNQFERQYQQLPLNRQLISSQTW